jgi:hypothetical protein
MRALLSCLAAGVLLVGVSGPAAADGHRPGQLRLSSASVPEDAAPGTEVGVLSATDEDRHYRHTFELVPGAGDSGNSLFRISGDRLEVAGPLDHETAAVLSVRVRVTDARGLHRERSFRVSVADVNEAPTAIQLSPDSVVENSSGITVGTLTATDPDQGDRHTFALVPGVGDEDNHSFIIWKGQVVTASTLDYEAQQTYRIRVRATDAAGATFEQPLTVHVTDEPEIVVNHAPTAVTIDHNTFTFHDVHLFAYLSATDPDAGDTHTFALVSAVDSHSSDVSAYVGVVGNELRITANYCALLPGDYTVRVRAVDGGGLSVETDLLITVTNPAAPPRSPFPARGC